MKGCPLCLTDMDALLSNPLCRYHKLDLSDPETLTAAEKVELIARRLLCGTL